tara:strand:+ start:379 stop:675 length:297 start_codon:yes stop_codon:yes gene_type:complete
MGLDHEAIRKAYPSITTIDDSFVNYGLDKDGKSVTLDQSKIDSARTTLNAEAAAIAYKGQRKAEYPTIEDQLDDIYHNGIDAWKATIKAIKDKYPKPS